jgi:hypothetical protein
MRLRIATIAASLRFVFANAGIAQLVEQLICNQQVVGSSPTAGSVEYQQLMRFSHSSRTACLDTSWTLSALQIVQSSYFLAISDHRSARRCRTQVKTASWVSMSISRRVGRVAPRASKTRAPQTRRRILRARIASTPSGCKSSIGKTNGF